MAAGDPPTKFSAGAWNSLMLMAEEYFAGEPGVDSPGDVRVPLPPGVIWIKNDSGDDCPTFSVLGVDDMLVNPNQDLDQFRFDPTFVGVSPADPDHVGRFAILLEAIADGDIGRAVISGAVAVQVDVQSQDDQFAEIVDDDTTMLESGGGGSAQILWKPSGTGKLWCHVRVGGGGASARVGVVQSGIDGRSETGPGTGNVTIKTKDANGDWVDGQTVEAFNPYSADLSDGTWVVLVNNLIVGADCA